MQRLSHDARHNPRRRMLKSGALQSGTQWQPCVVLDLSRGGAKLHLNEGGSVRDEVVLQFPDGVLHRAQCRWRQDTFVGVEFRNELTASPAALDRAAPDYLPHAAEEQTRIDGTVPPACLVLLAGLLWVGIIGSAVHLLH